ncbi:MAG: AarF/UbiB family protein [Planctomycetota bacterium]
MEAELGAPLAALFREFETVPLGAASLAQVQGHRSPHVPVHTAGSPPGVVIVVGEPDLISENDILSPVIGAKVRIQEVGNPPVEYVGAAVARGDGRGHKLAVGEDAGIVLGRYRQAASHLDLLAVAVDRIVNIG